MSGSVSKKSKKKAGWKKYQLQTKTRHKINLGLYVLLLIVGLVVLGKLITFTTGLTKPYSPDLEETGKNYNWNGNSTLNLVVKSQELFVLSFNPASKTMVAIKIPEDTYLDLPFNFGRWPARSIYDLGQAEKPPLGAALLKATITTSFDLPVDGYVVTSGNFADLSTEEVLEKLRKEPLGGFNLLRQSRSDLSFWEMMQLLLKVRGVRGDKVKITDLGQSPITKSLLLADGSRVLGIDSLRLDQFLSDQIHDSLMEESDLTIGIFNATDHPQLAEKAARMVTNMGGRVIFTANASLRRQDSLVSGPASYTTTRLAQVFAPYCLKDPCANSEGDPVLSSSRAEANVVLGEDFFLKTVQRPGI
ncbi:MAG: hypothetical protein UU73_C0003G0162 [Candidatus Daviesbacteria bacterium GW2011_GWA1_41_61]|nr:MAG: hypothetical protein UU26_C0003G0064 [Candidatus Daviesbacteria bacterium GW2011_GWC1_40_9]KKR93488.1 MAG: hypothetical protein UU44_C0002G0149 [Candidatus Daviesbacteria bacterium GW2011_GWB1_41_15]KKS14963.1 MAG: hypothetical protein UU73_C0003G0162 [Candidatus Daviesbacteria bacterium GW2011_GWA1_41_61]